MLPLVLTGCAGRHNWLASAGAEAQAEALADSTVQTVIAVSCNPVTFARDARLLIEGGYHMTSVQPVDQFQWSVETELVAAFTR